MNYRELTRRLKSLSCAPDRNAKGSHEIRINLETNARTTIPNWGSRDLKPGTVSGILRDLGIRKADIKVFCHASRQKRVYQQASR